MKSPEDNPVLSHLLLWTCVSTFPHLDVKPASNEFPFCATEDKQRKPYDVDSDT